MLPSISYRLRGIISEQKDINRAQNTGESCRYRPVWFNDNSNSLYFKCLS